MKREYRFCEDWLSSAQAEAGSWWTANTETWPEWLDAADEACVDVDALTECEGAVERHMVPLVTAWNTGLSPTASAVSAPTGADLGGVTAPHALGVIGFPRWQRVPDEHTHDLSSRAARDVD